VATLRRSFRKKLPGSLLRQFSFEKQPFCFQSPSPRSFVSERM
jgi:hypothetical protein